MRSIRLWQSLLVGFAVVLSVHCAEGASSGNPGDLAPTKEDKILAVGDESRIYSGEFTFPMQGWEFRRTISGDKVGPGIVTNARNDLQNKCKDLQTLLQTNLKSSLMSFACLDLKNVSRVAGRAIFQADVKIKFIYPHIVKIAYSDPIEGDYKLSKDFASSALTRSAARESWLDKCEAYTTAVQNTHSKYLLFVDCGMAVEKGKSDGWGFSSLPTIYFYTDDPPPLACGNHTHAEKWYDVDPADPVRVNVSCEFGGSRQETYENKKEYVCDNGSVLETGRRRTGVLIGTTGRCDQPQSCGVHAHDSRWWQVDGANTITEAEICQYGGNRVRVYEREILQKCWNGTVLDAGLDRQGRFIGYQGRCDQPRNCGRHSHSDRWWEIDHGNPIVDRVRCPNGGGQQRVFYERNVRYLCEDGRISSNGETRGREIRREGICPPPPPPPPPSQRACGSHPHNDRWSEVDRGNPIVDRVRCPNGRGQQRVFYQRVVRYICNDGNTSSLGEARGSEIRREGNCNEPPPPNNGGGGNGGGGPRPPRPPRDDNGADNGAGRGGGNGGGRPPRRPQPPGGGRNVLPVNP